MSVSLLRCSLAMALAIVWVAPGLRADEPYLKPPEDDDAPVKVKAMPVTRIEPLPVPGDERLPAPIPGVPVSPILGLPVSHEEHVQLKDVTPPELEAPVHSILDEKGPREGGLFGSVELLLMRPRLGSQDYAIVDPVSSLTPAGPLRSVTDDLRTAVHVEFGYRLPNSGWDISFGYFNLHSQGGDSSVAPPGGLIYPETTRPGLTDSALNAMATARLNYNTYDILLGRTMEIDQWTQIRAFTGIRFATIDQTLSATYNGLQASDAYTTNQSNFSGAGPIFGAELRFNVWHGLSLFGEAEGGLIYGNTRASLAETNNSGGTIYTDVTDSYHSMVPMVGFRVGGSWQYRGLTVSAGYQAMNWFGLIQRPVLDDSFSEGKIVPQNGDLSIDGFFIKLAYVY
jgi:hypothetical protein